VIPEAFERILLKVLSKSPDDRYQTAEEMAQAIRAAAEEAHIQPPDRISLPLMASVAAAAEPISVISGTARQRSPTQISRKIKRMRAGRESRRRRCSRRGCRRPIGWSTGGSD